MKIVVMGGAGYIGSHTAMHLSQHGHEVIVFDNFCRGHRWAVKWGAHEEVDLLDENGLNAAFERHRPDAVLHFAAFALVGESMGDPEMYYRNNFVGSLNLLKAMDKNRVAQLVFSSTCAVYGTPDSTLIGEDDPKSPVNPYGHSKLMIEQVIADFSRAHNLRACNLRYFNAAGCDPEGRAGEVHDPETHLIPCIFNALLQNQPFKIFGDDYDTPDGTCIRDYVHVLDLASAHRLALEKLPSLQRSAYNLGTGRGHSVREVIQAVERVTGGKVEVQVAPRRAGDPPRLVASAGSANGDLGWDPAWVELDRIVESAWSWHRRYFADKT